MSSRLLLMFAGAVLFSAGCAAAAPAPRLNQIQKV